MIRLVGVDLPKSKKIEYALTYVHGIGLSTAKEIVKSANVNPDIRTKDLTDRKSVV